MDASGKLWIGTSGWVYKHWRGDWYPKGLPHDQELHFYTHHFDTVEINYSFYHLPERSVFEGWRKQTPEGFLFAVKGSRFLTHMKKLKDPEEPLTRLMDRASGLGPKLGPILFQFPHQWKLNLPRLEQFVSELKRFPETRFAFEFRHETWLCDPVFDLLSRGDHALCLPVHPQMPVAVRRTASWSYVRFHGGRTDIGFKDDEWREWADHIGSFLADSADVYAYFNNDIGGQAVRDAPRLREMLRERLPLAA